LRILILVGQLVHPNAKEIAEESGEDEEKDEEARGLEIEEETDEKEVAVAECQFGEFAAIGEFGPIEPFRMEEAIAGEDKKEEGPEVELGEKERMFLVKRKEVSKKCK